MGVDPKKIKIMGYGEQSPIETTRPRRLERRTGHRNEAQTNKLNLLNNIKTKAGCLRVARLCLFHGI
jgi:hypothetical protein